MTSKSLKCIVIKKYAGQLVGGRNLALFHSKLSLNVISLFNLDFTAKSDKIKNLNWK